jgi:hypothetical protein
MNVNVVGLDIAKNIFHLFYILADGKSARVAPISDSVIGGMLASKCAITQANRTYILNGSLFAICCPCKFIFFGG